MALSNMQLIGSLPLYYLPGSLYEELAGDEEGVK